MRIRIPRITSSPPSNGIPAGTGESKKRDTANLNHLKFSVMSNPSNQKLYAKGIYVSKKDIRGTELFEISISVDSFYQFINQHRDEKGYVRIACWPKREADKYGTHNAELNTWKPSGNATKVESDLPF